MSNQSDPTSNSAKEPANILVAETTQEFIDFANITQAMQELFRHNINAQQHSTINQEAIKCAAYLTFDDLLKSSSFTTLSDTHNLQSPTANERLKIIKQSMQQYSQEIVVNAEVFLKKHDKLYKFYLSIQENQQANTQSPDAASKEPMGERRNQHIDEYDAKLISKEVINIKAALHDLKEPPILDERDLQAAAIYSISIRDSKVLGTGAKEFLGSYCNDMLQVHNNKFSALESYNNHQLAGLHLLAADIVSLTAQYSQAVDIPRLQQKFTQITAGDNQKRLTYAEFEKLSSIANTHEQFNRLNTIAHINQNSSLGKYAAISKTAYECYNTLAQDIHQDYATKLQFQNIDKVQSRSKPAARTADNENFQIDVHKIVPKKQQQQLAHVYGADWAEKLPIAQQLRPHIPAIEITIKNKNNYRSLAATPELFDQPAIIVTNFSAEDLANKIDFLNQNLRKKFNVAADGEILKQPFTTLPASKLTPQGALQELSSKNCLQIVPNKTMKRYFAKDELEKYGMVIQDKVQQQLAEHKAEYLTFWNKVQKITAQLSANSPGSHVQKMIGKLTTVEAPAARSVPISSKNKHITRIKTLN